MTPTTAQPPPRIGELTPAADEPFRAQIGSIPYAAFTSPFNSTGQPALSIPAGQTADRASAWYSTGCRLWTARTY